MARDKPPAKWDVWFVAADQVYRGVPTDVAAGWAGAGRLGPNDKLRPAGSSAGWLKPADVPGVGGFLYAPPPTAGAAAGGWPDLETDPPPRRKEAPDDEVDMIPLIDVSLVLLVFFMITTTVSVTSAVDVPEMKNAGDLSAEGSALVIQVEPGPGGRPVYAVRGVDQTPGADDANLPDPAALFARLDARLGSAADPPAVRIACHQTLPTEAAWAILPGLDKRQKDKRIRGYTGDARGVAK